MGTTAEKINYAINATNDIAEGINNIGGNITQNTELADFKDELDILYRQMPKVSQDGTSVSLVGTRRGKLEITPKGNTEQTITTGKNKLPNNLINGTLNGISYVVNEDKTVILNGTATSNCILNILISPLTLVAGSYILSGCPRWWWIIRQL